MDYISIILLIGTLGLYSQESDIKSAIWANVER